MDASRLRELLGNPGLAWIIERARARLERGEPLAGTIRLSAPSAAQRESLRRLLGLGQLRGEGLSVRLEELDAMLAQAEVCSGLAEAVVELTGPVSNLRQARISARLAWEQLFEAQRSRWASVSDRPELLLWLNQLQIKGTLARVSGGDPEIAGMILSNLSRLVAAFPAGLVTRGELAASLYGDAHALDEDQVLGRLGLQAAVAWAGGELADSAEGRRVAWEQVGVLVDTLSAPLLALNLHGQKDSVVGRLLDAHAAVGEPARLSARCLLRHPPLFSRAQIKEVFVCENPSIVAAAADRLGKRSAPLLCTEGQPRTAAHLVLRALVQAGISVRYHGDFDWPGIAIANLLLEQHGIKPWRMSAADYRTAPPGKSLHGAPCAPLWDRELQAAMQDRGCAVHEEQVMDLLLRDLDLARWS